MSPPKPAPLAQLLSIVEVARRLGVSEKTIRRQIADGELSAYRVGRQLRISEEDLMAYLAHARFVRE